MNSSAGNFSSGYIQPPLATVGPLLLVLAGAIFVAIFGNLFTVYVYIRHPNLRTPFNFYVFNLAIADLFVGVLVMPCYAIYNFYGYWPFGEPMCSVWVFTDWFMTFESVLCLAIISSERLWSITWPVSYRHKSTLKFTGGVIVVSWLFICCIWMPGFFYDRLNHDNVVEDCSWDPAKNLISGSVIGVLGYILPFTVMIVCYVLVGWKMRKRLGGRVIPRTRNRGPDGYIYTDGNTAQQSQNYAETKEVDIAVEKSGAQRNVSSPRKESTRRTPKKDHSAFITLGAILLAFCACWLPFYVYFFATLYNTIALSSTFLTATYWLAYLNSAFNPLLNTLLHREFRLKFKEMLRGRF